MALTPTFETYQSWTTVKDAAAWAGVKAELWTRAATELGDAELTSLMLLGGVADDEYRAAIDRVAPTVTALQRSSLNLMFNGVKAAMGVPTLILQKLAVPLPGAAEAVARMAPSAMIAQEPTISMQGMIPKVKLSQVIDQGKEAEVPLLDEATLSELRKNYTLLLGDSPMENAEVTDSQTKWCRADWPRT